MQNWEDLYQEHANAINAKIPEVKWVDLWHNQVNFLDNEHPFPTPAVFLNYRIRDTKDLGNNAQEATLQVEMYVFYETFADTYQGSHNKASALSFLSLITKLHTHFHGTSGANYNNMRSTGMQPVDTGNAGNLYVRYFECTVTDESASHAYTESAGNEVDITPGPTPVIIEEPIFIIP